MENENRRDQGNSQKKGCEDGKNEREIQRLKEFTESVETMKRETAKFQQELENRYKTELSRIPLFQHER